MRVLVVEDSTRLAESIRLGLRKVGHAVDIASDGRSGLTYARLNPYAAIVLDLMLPGLDGLSLLRSLRARGSSIPVLILSARDAVEDRVAGLRAGADDYLVKPFTFDELLARIETLARRPTTLSRVIHEIGDLRIDAGARAVSRGSRPIRLGAREYALLLYLASRAGEVVSRIEIEDHLYDERTLPSSNAVESAICALRARLAAGGGKALIHTRRGFGYVLSDADP